jgi:DNA-directed RNA polymerase sigma subunit (sigma70/sigma32)
MPHRPYPPTEKHEILSQQEELNLSQKIRSGDTLARTIFIQANLRLVEYVARKHADR